MTVARANHRLDDGVGTYLSHLQAESAKYNAGNLRFYLDGLFDGVRLEGMRVLDIGAGDGVQTFYAAAAGAARVVALEPEAAGSRPGVAERFTRMADRLGIDSVELVGDTFQEFDSDDDFDVVLLHSSINHLDEEACKVLHTDERARHAYRRLFAKLAALSADGGRLVVADASRSNLFARLRVKNPLQPNIEWEKHQSPWLWARLLEEAGFVEPRVRWTSFNTLRKPGRVLLGNAVAAWMTLAHFQLTMTRAPRRSG